MTTTTPEPVPSGAWEARLSTGRPARLRLDVEGGRWAVDVWRDDRPDTVMTSAADFDSPGWYALALAFGAIAFPDE